MSRSTSHKRRRIVRATSRPGIPRSLHLLACEYRAIRRIAYNFNWGITNRYLMSVILKRIFMFKCTLPMLRLTTTFTLLALPIVFTKLLCFNQRERPPSSLLSPSIEALVLSSFPVAWFFGFLYYTEVPSVLTVAATIVFATQGRHSLAALVRRVLRA